MARKLEWHAANGDRIIFSESKPFILRRCFPGTSAGAAEAVRSIRADGQKTYHVAAEPLTPSMTGSLHGQGATFEAAQKDHDELRMRLQAALNPKHFGTLIYTTYAGAFRLDCRPLRGAEIGERVGASAPIDIEWVSDDPYWSAAMPSKLDVGVVSRLWRFPWAIKPTVFGSILASGIVINPTNVDIYPKVVISETESTRITVGNHAAGVHTTITHGIARDQKLELDMSVPSAHLVEPDGTRTDVIHWTDVDSDFPWAISPGENEIYSAVDDPSLSPIISIIWHQPEVGL